jgi:hypothetical protein
MIDFYSFVYITRHTNPCLEFKCRYKRNSLTLEIIQKGYPMTLDRRVALFLLQPVSVSLSKDCFPWNVLTIYRYFDTFRVKTVACHSIKKFYEHGYVTATEWSPINGEDDCAVGILLAHCCFAVHTLLASPYVRKSYSVVITSKIGVHGTEYKDNYAERRNITAQARCKWKRFMFHYVSIGPLLYCSGSLSRRRSERPSSLFFCTMCSNL